MRGTTVHTGSHPAMHRENHYVPRLYLKHFEAVPGKIQTYRLLVSHSHISALETAQHRCHWLPLPSLHPCDSGRGEGRDRELV